MKHYFNKKNIETVLGVAALVFIILLIASGSYSSNDDSSVVESGVDNNATQSSGVVINVDRPTKKDIVLDNDGQPIEKNDSLYFSGTLQAPTKYFKIRLSSGSYYVDVAPDGSWDAEIPLNKIHEDENKVSFVANFSTKPEDYNIQTVVVKIESIPGFKPGESKKVPLSIDWTKKIPTQSDVKSDDPAIQKLLDAPGARVGEVMSGTYAGYGLYVKHGFCEEMCYSKYTVRYLLDENNTKIVTLSDQGLSLSSIESYLDGYGKNQFGFLNQHEDIINSPDMFIPEIERSGPVSIKDSAYELSEISNLTGYVKPRVGGNFDQSKVIGYTIDGREVFGGTDIYIQRIDGTYAEYEIDTPFFGEDKIPQIKWNDGTTNISGYSTEVMTGCGATSEYSIRDDISLNPSDFVITGVTSNNDLVYTHVDSQHDDLVKLHKERGWRGYGEDREEVPYDEFIDSVPFFFWVSPFGQVVEFKRQEYRPLAECGKPVIYLYPEEEEVMHVRVALMGEMTVSEPEHGPGGWDVVVHTNGYVTNLVDGLVYPNLFWEGYGVHYEIPSEGFVISQNNIEVWLSGTLDEIGFTAREKAEFLEFWIDKIPETPYVFFTFIDQEYFDEYAALEISPEPDTINRVFMEYRGLDEYVEVEPLVLPKIIREGFTVVEWGGALREE